MVATNPLIIARSRQWAAGTAFVSSPRNQPRSAPFLGCRRAFPSVARELVRQLKALQGKDNVRIESTPQTFAGNNAAGMIQNITEETTRQTHQGETTTTTFFVEYLSASTRFFCCSGH